MKTKTPKRKKSRPAKPVVIKKISTHSNATLSDAALRVNITRIGSHSRFFICKTNGESVVTSRLYDSPVESRNGLIAFIMAIQADDFDSFDLT